MSLAMPEQLANQRPGPGQGEFEFLQRPPPPSSTNELVILTPAGGLSFTEETLGEYSPHSCTGHIFNSYWSYWKTIFITRLPLKCNLLSIIHLSKSSHCFLFKNHICTQKKKNQAVFIEICTMKMDSKASCNLCSKSPTQPYLPPPPYLRTPPISNSCITRNNGRNYPNNST